MALGGEPAFAEHQTARWRARMPREVLAVGGPGLLAVGVGLSVALSWDDSGPWSVAEVTSPAWVSTSAVVGAALGAAALLAVRPHGTIGWASFVAAVLAVLDQPTRAVWVAVSLLLATAAAVDHAGAAHQRALAAGLAPPPGDRLSREVPEEVAEDWRRGAPTWRGVLGVAAVVAAVVCAGWYLRDARLAEGFRSQASAVPGTVVERSDDDLQALVRTQDGRELWVPIPGTYPEPGQAARVLVAADGARTELVGDPFDASLVLLPAGALLTVGGLLLDAERRSRSRLRRLLTAAARPRRVVLVAHDGPWTDLRDARSGALLAAARVDRAWVPYPDAVDDDAPRSIGTQDDRTEEGLEDLDDVADLDDLDVPPGRSEPLVADVHGLESFGDEAVVARTEDGAWLVLRDVRASLPRRRRRPRPQQDDDSEPSGPASA